ncbi:MAG TPA: mercuric reductase [Planctomycetaceae bacterium]|nr:mercuric reductase [Planctomycetaceae bacterium]
MSNDDLNADLFTQVHPPDWRTPTPTGRYNLVVIGAGTAGLVSAAGAAGLGAKVALIERGLMGGDCLNTGCVPSKALLRSAHVAASVRDADRFGVRVPAGTQVDFPAVMERLRRMRTAIAPNDSAARFASLGVDVYFGEATFVSPDAIEVGGTRLDFRAAVIATGARPAIPQIPGMYEAVCLTSENVFSLTELPARLAVIGGGPIGCELAQAFARCGSQVTLFQAGPRLLPRDEPDAARLIATALEHDGVRLLLSSRIERIESTASGRAIHYAFDSTGSTHVEADAILVAAGRTANIEGLNLQAAAVLSDPRHGVIVDEHLRTTNRRIFAAGDVCSAMKFTHAADFQARIVIQNALFRGRARASSLIIPWCTYTDPEVAHIGLTEAEAKQRGVAIRTFTQPLHEVDRARLEGAEEGFVRIHVRAGSDRIVGATIVAPHAGDLIGEVSLAMTARIGLKKLAQAIHPYPTLADALRRTGDAYNRTRLTPFVKGLFERWLRWQRW